jgi:hypothetical protein
MQKSTSFPTAGSSDERKYRPGATLGDVLMTITRWPTTVGRIAHPAMNPNAIRLSHRWRPRKPAMKAAIKFSRLGIEFIRQLRSLQATDAAEFYALPRSRMTVAIAPTSCRGASGLQ